MTLFTLQKGSRMPNKNADDLPDIVVNDERLSVVQSTAVETAIDIAIERVTGVATSNAGTRLLLDALRQVREIMGRGAR